MRVALFDDRFDQVYGAQENVLLMALLCTELGHETMFVTTEEGALASEARDRGLSVAVVASPETLRRFEGKSFDGGSLGAARMAIDLVRYNVRLASAIRDMNVDVIVSAAVRPTSSLLVARLLVRVPIVLYAQNSIPRGALAVVTGLASRRIGLIGRGAKATFPDWFLQRFDDRFIDLPSGRDLSEYPPRLIESAPGERQEDTRIITISSVTERKGLHVLIDAVAQLQDQGCAAHLTIVGGTTGPVSEAYRSELERQAVVRSVDVEFVGWRDDVVPLLADADIFAMASENEGLPGVLLEAMASGLPCVTTKAGSAGDLVDKAGAGFSVAIGDVTGIADALAILCRDGAERAQMGGRGRAYVEDHHSLASFRDRVEAVLNDVVSPAVAPSNKRLGRKPSTN